MMWQIVIKLKHLQLAQDKLQVSIYVSLGYAARNKTKKNSSHTYNKGTLRYNRILNSNETGKFWSMSTEVYVSKG